MMRDLNFHSNEWLFVFDAAQKEIEESIKALCSETCPAEKIPALRGRISALKQLIERDKDRFKKLTVNPFF